MGDVGVKALGVEGEAPPRVIDFALVLMRFLMICGGGGGVSSSCGGEAFPRGGVSLVGGLCW